jgi:Skp family chaperone for outer membrane proteins
MKRYLYLAAPATAAALLITSAQAQAPQPEQQLVSLAKEVKAQQDEIAANQDKIDAKLAGLAEALRQARIYSSRGGR